MIGPSGLFLSRGSRRVADERAAASARAGVFRTGGINGVVSGRHVGHDWEPTQWADVARRNGPV
jgi:hypothetical protein